MRALVARCLRTVRLSRAIPDETTAIVELCLTVNAKGKDLAPASLESWKFVQQMLADLTNSVIEDATSERELLEGLGVLAKATALCTEMTVEADPQRPRFFDTVSYTHLRAHETN